MGKGERIIKKIYIRELSNEIKRHEKTFQAVKQFNIDDVVEDTAVVLEPVPQKIFRMICRNKQRLCQRGMH